MNDWVNGGCTPDEDDRKDLAKIFSCSVDDIVPPHVEKPVKDIINLFTKDTPTSERIKLLMGNKGLSQSQLADEIKKVNPKSGVNIGRVNGWVNTDRIPNEQDRADLAKIFDCTVDDIVPSRIEKPIEDIIKLFTKDTPVKDRIRLLMENKGFIQQELADKIKKVNPESGVNQSRVSHWVNMGNTPSEEGRADLAKVFGCTVDDIVPSHIEKPIEDIIKLFTKDTPTKDRIRLLMRNKGFTMQQLVDEIKNRNHESTVKLSGVNNWVNRGNIPNEQNRADLAKVFGCSVEDIVPER